MVVARLWTLCSSFLKGDLSKIADERAFARVEGHGFVFRIHVSAHFLWHRERLATLRGQWMYFYTSLGRGNGLAGVNLNTGQTDREVRLSELDERFVTDELLGGLFTASGNKLLSHGLH